MMARILIVEDEVIIAADLGNKMRRMGHEVTGTAISAAEAIAMADEAKPDLVLMDVQLDGELSGPKAASVIQQRTGARVIFITAFPHVFLSDPSMMSEPGICIGKPYSRAQLEAAIGAALVPR